MLEEENRLLEAENLRLVGEFSKSSLKVPAAFSSLSLTFLLFLLHCFSEENLTVALALDVEADIDALTLETE